MLKLAVLACGGMLLGPVQATSVQQLKDKITLTHARAPVAASTHSFPAEAVSSASSSSSSLSSSSRLQAAVSEPIVNDELNASKKKLLVEEVGTEAVAEAQQEEMELLPHEADKVQDKASLVEAAVRGHTKGAHGAEAAHLSKNQMPFGMPFKYPQTLPEYDIALEYMEQVTMKQPPLWIKYHEVQLIYDQKSVDTQTQAIANLDFRPKPALNFVFAEDQAKMDAAFERAKQLCSDFSTEVKTFATLPQAEQTPAQTQTIAEMGKACTAAENTAKETKKAALERPQLMDQKHREQVNQRLLHAQEQLQYDQAALGKQKILITQQDQYHLKLVVERNQLAYSQNQPAWVVGTILTH